MIKSISYFQALYRLCLIFSLLVYNSVKTFVSRRFHSHYRYWGDGCAGWLGAVCRERILRRRKKKWQLLCKFGPCVFVTMRSVKLFSSETRDCIHIYAHIHTLFSYCRSHKICIHCVLLHATTISDFMSFSAWRNKVKLKSPHFLLYFRRAHFFSSKKKCRHSKAEFVLFYSRQK